MSRCGEEKETYTIGERECCDCGEVSRKRETGEELTWDGRPW